VRTFTAFDLVRLVHEVERVSASKIPNEQKTLVLTELKHAVPEPIFCPAGLATRDYVLDNIQGALNGCAEKTTGKVPAKKGADSPTESAEEQLLRNSDGDTRGKGVKAGVVKKTTQKPRKAKRSA